MEIAIVIAASLAIVAIVSTRLGQRFGVPALVLFVGVGMFAGSSGPLGIEFTDFRLGYNLGVVALALILFYGGLDTRMRNFRAALVPAAALATLGTVLTMLCIGLAAYYLTSLDFLTSMLLGAVISSTDAAAVFSSLRGRGLPKRLRATLETESGTNDPTAVLLTFALAQAINQHGDVNVLAIAGNIVLELAIGAVLGVGLGWLLKLLVNKVALDNVGLYPVLALAGALLAFGLTDILHGNGYLAIYLVGLVLGNHYLAQRLAIVNFMNGAAWAAQLVMFLVMGLLVSPDQLPAILGVGLLITAATILVARPVAVISTLALLRWASRGRYQFGPKEQLLLTWAGLKGAVPIILAMVPLMQRVPDADVIFNIVFVVVIVGTLLQGFTLSPLARLLGLAKTEPPRAKLRLELGGEAPEGAAVVDVFLGADNRAVGQCISELDLPTEVVIAAVLRDGQLVTPRGSTVFKSGDHVYLLGPNLDESSVPRAFGRNRRASAAAARTPATADTPATGDVPATVDTPATGDVPATGDTPATGDVPATASHAVPDPAPLPPPEPEPGPAPAAAYPPGEAERPPKASPEPEPGDGVPSKAPPGREVEPPDTVA